MQKRIHKYGLKFLTILLLTSFLTSNFCLSQLIEDCNFKKSSCCCKNPNENISDSLDLHKKCCCEIKEFTKGPAEINLSVNETIQKISIFPSKATIGFNDHNLNILVIHFVKSFHSPPGENIYIFNSNFRI